MKSAVLLHNPSSGDESHTKKELKSMIEEEGFKCSYSSTKKKGWDEIPSDGEFIIIAGGDGTVRKVIKNLIENHSYKLPIALFPAGTANNIAKTLDIPDGDEEVIRSWHKEETKDYDVGRISNLSSTHFFLESFGYGVFPLLMKEMKKQNKKDKGTAEDELDLAIRLLHDVIRTYEAPYCELEIDGTDHSGKYLLAEIMNIQSIGPNLHLSPSSDPGDGEFEVVLIPEEQKDLFLDYVDNLIKGGDGASQFDIRKGKNIRIKCNELYCHADDELIKIKKATEVKIELAKGLVKFLI
jgi:diacylglycerol kinase (ATP)